jgi:6,7-dimethyl-8-ribityllumazine synthase
MPPALVAIEPDAVPRAPRVAVVVSRYNQWITDRLLDGAAEAFARLAGDAPDGDAWRMESVPAPGTFELPGVAAAALATGRFDAAVCLGCVIRGETSHDRHIASAVAGQIAALASADGGSRPVAFGVITAENADQAEARAGGTHGNKGAEAMEAALGALAAVRALRGEA